MKVESLKIEKEDNRGKIYNCDKVRLIERKAGSICADHEHKQGEVLFLIEGAIELTVGDKTVSLKAPKRIEIPAEIYHKLLAKTDIKLLEYRF